MGSDEAPGIVDRYDAVIHSMENQSRLPEVRIAREAGGILQQLVVDPSDCLLAIVINLDPIGFLPPFYGGSLHFPPSSCKSESGRQQHQPVDLWVFSGV